MKYERTDSFKRDYRRLTEDEKKVFREAANEFNAALETREADPTAPWPTRLRIKGVAGAAGVWELTWNFSDPDGRATWEWTKIDGGPGVRWRRVGDHSIFNDP